MKLKRLLEDLVGEQKMEWVIPHPFLPPRYRKICENRNMVLILSPNYTLHIRWEGARRGERISPTPGEVRRLLREVKRNISKYNQELKVFSKFVDEWAEEPNSDPVKDDPSSTREPRKAELLEEDPQTPETFSRRVGSITEMGGEAPIAVEFFQ